MTQRLDKRDNANHTIHYLQRLANAFDVLGSGLGEKKQNGIQDETRHINGTSGILKTREFSVNGVQ